MTFLVDQPPSMIFSLVEEIHQKYGDSISISEMCKMANVSRSGYYAWKRAAPKREKREAQDRADFSLILKAFAQEGYEKGARGLYMTMLHWKPMVIMNLKKIHRLMTKYGLKCSIRKPSPHRRAAKENKTSNYAANELERRFREFGPRMVLLTDITYLFYGEHGKQRAYLSTIKDSYTNEILAYYVSNGLEVDGVLITVQNLICDYGISLHKETILHSDQGSQSTSIKLIYLLNDVGLRRSMSRRANCWDNAPQESFFGHMKDEIDVQSCNTFKQVKEVIDRYIDYYNNRRYQWNLCKLSPKEFYDYSITRKYPLNISNPPELPPILRKPEELRVTLQEVNAVNANENQ